MSPALSILHNSLKGTCHTSPPTHHSILLWQHNSPHFDTHSLLLREWGMYCGGAVVAIPYNDMCNIYCEHQKLGQWCSSSKRQKHSCVPSTIPPFLTLTVKIAQFIVRNLSQQPPPLPTGRSLLLGLHHSSQFDTHSSLHEWVSDALLGGGAVVVSSFTMKCARFSVSVKNGGSDVAAQYFRKHI